MVVARRLRERASYPSRDRGAPSAKTFARVEYRYSNYGRGRVVYGGTSAASSSFDIDTDRHQVVAAVQSARCSQCGVPFCQVHCPLHNNIPDWLRLTAEGRLQEAYELSQATNEVQRASKEMTDSQLQQIATNYDEVVIAKFHDNFTLAAYDEAAKRLVELHALGVEAQLARRLEHAEFVDTLTEVRLVTRPDDPRVDGGSRLGKAAVRRDRKTRRCRGQTPDRIARQAGQVYEGDDGRAHAAPRGFSAAGARSSGRLFRSSWLGAARRAGAGRPR